MIKKIVFIDWVFLISSIVSMAQNHGGGHQISKIFEPGIISTDAVEYSSSFSSSGSEIYFARSHDKWGSGGKSSIYHSIKTNNQWSPPELVSFSGNYNDSGPHLTQDGGKIYFISHRPSNNNPGSADIWMVEKDNHGQWGTPVRLKDPINSPGREYSPRTDKHGNLYFASDRLGGYGQGDLYISRNVNGVLSPPENMGNTINSPKGEWNLEINDEGNLLIFEASGRSQNVTVPGDLYISFRERNTWTIPQNIEELNTSGSDLYPELTNNGEKLYFTSSDSLNSEDTNLYFTEFNPIYDKYRQQAKLAPQYLMVVNRSSHDVSLVDLMEKKLVKKLSVGIGPHEITVSKDHRYAFVANYGTYPKPHADPITSDQLQWIEDPQNTITQVNLSTLGTQTFAIPGSDSYHGILTNQQGSVVWITDQNRGRVLEIDGQTGAVLKEYATMVGSHILKSSLDYSKLFVSNIESNTISVIDRESEQVTNINTPKGPEGMELSPDGQHLWVLCNSANKIMVLDINTLTPINTFDSHGKFPIKLTFVGHEAWVANVPSKNISIFDALTFEFKDQLTLESTPLGITSNGDKVFITLPRMNLVQVYDVESRKKLWNFSYGMEPDGLLLINDIAGRIRN